MGGGVRPPHVLQIGTPRPILDAAPPR